MFGRSAAYSCRRNGFPEFHHFMKTGRLNNSSKTFLNLWLFVNCKQKNVRKFPR